MMKEYPTTPLILDRQAFRQVWLWLILGGLALLGLTMAFVQLGLGIPVGNNPVSDVVLGGIAPLMLLPALLAAVYRLEVGITERGVTTRYAPFQRKPRLIPWALLAEVYVREYRPIAEYGGWGWRGFGKNRAINVSGNQGLQLVFKDGRKLLLGISKPKEMAAVLQKLGKSNSSAS